MFGEVAHHQYQRSVQWLSEKPSTHFKPLLTNTITYDNVSYNFKGLAYAFMPQLLRSRIWNDPAPVNKQFSTSYLNGLRGITAIKVFTFHYLMSYTDFTLFPWAADDRHNRWFLFPVIRYVYSGFTSQIFFACAGYLISLRMFQLLDKGDVTSQSKVFTSVAGSLFRRGFRLYLPVFIITFITTMHIYFGFYEPLRPYVMSEDYLPGPFHEERQAQMSFWPQIHGWLSEMYRLINFTSPDTIYCEQDQHLWSIHAEMYASLHTYGCLMAAALLKRWARLTALILLTVLYIAFDHWEVWIYLLSAIVAHLDIVLTERAAAQPSVARYELLPSADPQTPVTPTTPLPGVTTSPLMDTPVSLRRTIRARLTRFILFFISLYLMSFPVFYHPSSPGYDFLKDQIPDYMTRHDKFYPNFGAALFLFLLVRGNAQTSVWRRITNSPTALYLGSISFAIYLVHGPILHWGGWMIPQLIWWSAGARVSELSEPFWFFGLLVGWIVNVVIVLWVADVWAREVEGRCIRAVKGLEKLVFRGA